MFTTDVYNRTETPGMKGKVTINFRVAFPKYDKKNTYHTSNMDRRQTPSTI